jgi:hypothetical protein
MQFTRERELMYTTAIAASCHPMPENHGDVSHEEECHMSQCSVWRCELRGMRYATVKATELTNVWNESVFILRFTTVLDDFIYFFV